MSSDLPRNGIFVESVEYAHPGHSSPLELTSSPTFSTSENGDTRQEKAMGSPRPEHDSQPNTNGKKRKRRRMSEDEAIAGENQIMGSSSNGGVNPQKQDNGNKNGTSSHTESSKAFGDLEKDDTRDVYRDDGHDSGDSKNNFDSGVPTAQVVESPTGRKFLDTKRKMLRRRHDALPVDKQKRNGENQNEGDENKKNAKKQKKGKTKKAKSSSQQAATIPKEYVDKPTDNDILLGMPKFNKHPGNETYRETVREFQSKLKTQDRTEVAQNVVDHIHTVIRGRFLKIDYRNRWERVPIIDVLTKVSKALAELKSKNVPLVRKSPASSNGAGVLEASKKDDTQTPTRRRKRKPTMVRKMNNVRAEPGPQSNEQQKKKPKHTGSEKGMKQGVEAEPTFEDYIYKQDPNEHYVEETAHIYHNPPFPSEWRNGVKPEDLRSVPLPPPLPDFPKNDTCCWSYDKGARVVIADFLGGSNGRGPTVTLEDSKFLFEMLERTDITVICRGLLNMSEINPSMWNSEYLKSYGDREFYHKFRRFDRTVDENGIETYREMDGLYSMRFADYAEYCEQRGSFVATRSVCSTEEPRFTFEDHEGKEHSVGVWTSALYMIDVDMGRLMHLLNKNFLESFELPSVLPGGSHCMMNSVTPDARPFMGPNLYVTPPASFTHFHQDGHGTVDSGHLCVSGFNEVVMLRRLTERHKKHALWILSGKKPDGFHFDGLYSMPHGDGLGEKPPWPHKDMIEECRKMGYCPSVFTLEPGDLVHINKGRLHAFRKMSTAKLPERDCHAQLRRTIIESKAIAGEEKLCVSVAWDWMYRGITPQGIHREVSTVLEASALNRRNNVTSLAIPELALLQMARAIPARSNISEKGIGFLGALAKKGGKAPIYDSTKEEICKGIYPGLRHVVGQHLSALNGTESKSTEPGKRLSTAAIPDTQENPQTCPLDPYGNSDFQCKLCRKELSNVYFHCDGCEKLLSKDFNICQGCYKQEKFRVKVQMHPSTTKRHATLNHTGNNAYNRQKRCPCKNGPACDYCGFCLGCSCRCHTWFTRRQRLCNASDEGKLLQTVRDTAAEKSDTKTDGNSAASRFDYDEATKQLCDRLRAAGDEDLLNQD